MPQRGCAAMAALLALLAGMGGVVATPGTARAQTQELGVYEGRPIRAIQFRRMPDERRDRAEDGVAGVRELEPLSERDAQRARNNIRSAQGAPFRPEVVRSDVERLNRLNAFGRVETFVRLLDDGSVELFFLLEPQPLIRDVQVTGNRRLSDQRIAGAVDVLVGTPVDRFQIERAARRIEELYREQGFYLAEVTIDEDELREAGIVLFRIREGQRVKITDIRFEGNLSFRSNRLRRQVNTNVAGIFRRGAIDEMQLDRDVASIIEFYRNRGYLDVRADRVLRPSPDGREAILTFLIEEGRRYTFRDLTVEFIGGDREGFDPVFSEEQLLGLMQLNPGEVYGVQAVDASVSAIERAYGQLGYVDAVVQRSELRDPDEPFVDMLLRIRPGRRYLAGEIITRGNELTKDEVIRRAVEVRPARPLNEARIEATERNLRRLRLFNPRGINTTIQSASPASPEFRDVLIEVEETNTGSLDLGGAVNSDAGFIGRIALTQRNFDIADTPDSFGEFFSGRAFRGAGQTFNIEAAPGDQVEVYSISLSDPSLVGTDYSGSASLFFRQREFDEFDETRFGGRFGFGRRFGTRWNGRLNLRVESIDLGGFDEDDPEDFFDVEDETRLIGIGPSLSRNTLDNQIVPTRGSVTQLGFEFVTGDFNFQQLSGEYALFVPLRRDFFGRTTVLSLNTRASYIPQDREDVPTFERFFLGGQSFRGFDFRTISPRGETRAGEPSDEPIGGTWLFFAGAEVRQPIVGDIIALAGFIDTGTVTFDPGFEDYRVSIGAGVRLRVPQLSPAPFAFDFGFPIVDEETDEDRLFSFSIDLPF